MRLVLCRSFSSCGGLGVVGWMCGPAQQKEGEGGGEMDLPPRNSHGERRFQITACGHMHVHFAHGGSWWMMVAQAIFKNPSGSATKVPRILFAFAAMTQQVQPVAPFESSPNTKKMKEKAAQIRKSFQRPKFWVMGFGWCLAACAGAANVIAFKSWNLYASHVTGSTSAMAFRLEGYHQGEYGSESLKEACLLVFSFLCGAYACGLLIDKNQVHFGGKAFYGLALVLNSSLLASAAFIPGRLLPVCLVAAACGLQNAMCTSHFGAIIRTTHVTGTMTDIGSTFGRISMIYLRKGCRRSNLNDVERAEVGVDARKLAVLFGLWSFYFMGGLFGVYMENIIPGPPQRALLLPAAFTGSVGLFYMACRQILKDYIKKLERERFEADLKEAQDVLAHMGSRLQDLEHNDQSVVELDAEMGHMIDALHEVEADFENLVRTHSRMLERTDSATSKPDKV